MSDYWTHDISVEKEVTLEQLKNFRIKRMIHSHYNRLVNPVTEVEYSVELKFTEKNKALE